MAFGELADDEYQSDLGATRGNIGKGGVAGGGIRMAQVMLYLLDVYCGYHDRCGITRDGNPQKKRRIFDSGFFAFP